MCVCDDGNDAGSGGRVAVEGTRTSEKEVHIETRDTGPDRTRASKSSSACSQTQPAPLAACVSPASPPAAFPLLPSTFPTRLLSFSRSPIPRACDLSPTVRLTQPRTVATLLLLSSFGTRVTLPTPTPLPAHYLGPLRFSPGPPVDPRNRSFPRRLTPRAGNAGSLPITR